MSVKRAIMFWRFAVNIELTLKRVTLPTILRWVVAAVMPRAKTEQMTSSFVSLLRCDTHRAAIAGKAAGSKRRRGEAL